MGGEFQEADESTACSGPNWDGTNQDWGWSTWWSWGCRSKLGVGCRVPNAALELWGRARCSAAEGLVYTSSICGCGDNGKGGRFSAAGGCEPLRAGWMAAGEEIGAGMTGEVAEEWALVGWLFSGSAGDLEASEGPGVGAAVPRAGRAALETPEGSERDERNYLAWIFSPMLSVRRAVTLHQAHHGAAFGIGSGRGKETDRYVPTRLCLSKPRTGKLMALLLCGCRIVRNPMHTQIGKPCNARLLVAHAAADDATRDPRRRLSNVTQVSWMTTANEARVPRCQTQENAAQLWVLGCNGGAVRLVGATKRSRSGIGDGRCAGVVRLSRILVRARVKRGRWRGDFSSERCGQEGHDWARSAVTL